VTNLLDWDEEDLAVDPEAEYRMLLNGLRRTEGFGLFFVQCSPFGGEQIIQRVREDLANQTIAVLKLEAPIDDGNVFKRIRDFLDNQPKTQVLFIQGLELSLLDYEESKKRLGWSSKKIFSYSWHGVPPVLINLNQQRERFRDSFNTRLVFLLPIFAVKYLVHRAPDFFDWRSGIIRFSDDIDLLSDKAQEFLEAPKIKSNKPQLQKHIRQEILEIQSLLETDLLTRTRRQNLYAKQGDHLRCLNEPEASIYVYDRALELDSSDGNSWLQRGRSLSEIGRHTDALESFFKSVESNPKNSRAWARIGFTLMEIGRFEEAISKIDKGIEYTKSYYLYYDKAFFLCQSGNYKSAVQAFWKGFLILLDKYLSLLRKPGLLRKKILYDYRLFFKISPGIRPVFNSLFQVFLEFLARRRALLNQGYYKMNIGQYKEAISTYDSALMIKPGLHEALNNKGIALFNLGRYEEAIVAYNRAVAIKPDLHKALNNKGVALFKLSRYEEAIAAYDAALAIKPDKDLALYNKGFALGNLGRYEEAIATYDAALEIKPDDHKVLCEKGIALRKLCRYEEAISTLDAALRIRPNDASALYNKACCYSLQNQVEVALDNLQQSIQLNADRYRELAKTSGDFDNLRADPRFQTLLAERLE
jgi:tetratricopeptide (TPR) repeat protein